MFGLQRDAQITGNQPLLSWCKMLGAPSGESQLVVYRWGSLANTCEKLEQCVAQPMSRFPKMEAAHNRGECKRGLLKSDNTGLEEEGFVV